jgi:hypothetical protein
MGARKPLLIAALAAAFVAASYTGVWFYARGVALAAIANWVAQQRQAGYRIDHGPPRTGGFPFVVQITVDVVSAAPADERWRWRAAGLGVEIRPWNFRRVRLEALGAQRFMFRRDGAAIRIALDAAETVAVATIAPSGRVAGATLRIREARLSSDVGAFQAAEFWLEAAVADPPPSAHTQASLTVSLAAVDAVLPAAFEGALGREIETLRGDFKVMGAISGGPLRAAVEAWRVDGGTVEIEWLHVTWGPVDLRAKGTVALDAEHRPLGALSADIRGHAAALDALRGASVVSGTTATLAKIGLALLARTPPDGGAPVLSLPVTAQAGKLYLGPIKILNLPEIPWYRVQSR